MNAARPGVLTFWMDMRSEVQPSTCMVASVRACLRASNLLLVLLILLGREKTKLNKYRVCNSKYTKLFGVRACGEGGTNSTYPACPWPLQGHRRGLRCRRQPLKRHAPAAAGRRGQLRSWLRAPRPPAHDIATDHVWCICQSNRSMPYLHMTLFVIK